MNIYKHELKAYLKSTVMWIVVLSGIATIFMSFYPALKSDMDNFLKILDNYPPVMKAIMGLAAENFVSPMGVHSVAFMYSLLFGAIQAMNLGVGIVSKEERERTADFLMTKPISRVKILTAKLLSVFTVFVITNVIYTIITSFVVSKLSEGNFEVGKFVLINASLFFSQLIFFSIGLVVSICAKKIRSVLPVSLGMVFLFYAISAFAITAEDDKLRFFTPFQYFKTSTILMEGHYEDRYVIMGLIVVVASIVTSYILYKRKNIHSV